VLRYIPVREDGALDMNAAERLISARTRLVAVTHTSNVLGTLNPVQGLAELAHGHGALLLVDAAQSAPRRALDVEALHCDFLAFSGHKMLGPTGIGVLFGKAEHLEAMEPAAGGGGMIRKVWEQGATWNDLPWKLEAGTPNTAGAVGLAAAIEYLTALDLGAVQAHESALTGQALEMLGQVPGLSLYGGAAGGSGVISFNVDGVHPHDVAQVLDETGVAVRGGHHCCQLLMNRLGVDATVRMSFAPYNDRGDVERLVEGLARVREVFGHGR
jgi:cysteine desulfurase/selenocysteine lyase